MVPQIITPDQVSRMPGVQGVGYQLDRWPHTRYHWFAGQMAAVASWLPDGSGGYSLALPDGGVGFTSELAAVATLTATGTAQSGACEFGGIVIRALVGGPQTITVYDALSATGTPVAVFTVNAVGTYFWLGDWATPGNGRPGRRPMTTGCHVVISGGTSRTIDVMVA